MSVARRAGITDTPSDSPATVTEMEMVRSRSLPVRVRSSPTEFGSDARQAGHRPSPAADGPSGDAERLDDHVSLTSELHGVGNLIGWRA